VRAFTAYLLITLLCTPQAYAVQNLTTKSISPTLIAIDKASCLSGGKSFRLRGEHLSTERQYQLVLSTQGKQLTLEIEQWSDNAITASLPRAFSQQDEQALLVLRDRQSGSFASNRLATRLCSLQQSEPQTHTINTNNGRQQQVTSPKTPPRDDIKRQTSPQKPRPISTTASISMLAPSEDAALLANTNPSEEIEPGELILFSKDMEAAHQLDLQLKQFGHSIKRRRTLKQLGLVISTVRLAEGISVQDGLEQLRQFDPQLMIDANHRYRLSESDSAQAGELVAWKRITADCGKGLRLGLVDTLVDTTHPSLTSATVVSRSFLPLGIKGTDRHHATAIASLLLGQPTIDSSITGLLPGAELYNAGIFRQRDNDKVDTTAELIISALNWLQGQQVSAINISLTGSPNRLLHWVVEHLLKQDQLLAAAAGNAGPDAPPAYPAGWPGVVAVTAVDQKARAYGQANRGDYIDLAAPGVDVWAARPGTPGAYYSGTSYAVPYATAALAVLRLRNPDMNGQKLRKILHQEARDLGPPGRDATFGYGLLQMPDGCG
jgi:hypothetical protein